MSLSYFPMYPDDFEADTAHLTIAEDGAYNRLLRLCWRTPGCSVPSDREWIYRRMRAFSDDDKAVINIVLDEFFVTKGGRVSNARLTKEWIAASEAHEKRKNAGSKGAKAKSLKKKDAPPSNAQTMRKQPEPEPEPIEKETDKEKSVSPAKGSRLPDDWMPEPLSADFLERWPVTSEFCENQLHQFRDYWAGKPGAAGRKVDWQGTWRNWLRKGIEYQGGTPQNKSAQQNTISLLRKIMDDDERNSETAPEGNFHNLGLLATDNRD